MSIYDDDWGDGVNVSRTVSRAEQKRIGTVRSTRYVPAKVEESTALTPVEQTLLGQVVTAAGQIIAHRQMSHLAKSEETPIQQLFRFLRLEQIH